MPDGEAIPVEHPPGLPLELTPRGYNDLLGQTLQRLVLQLNKWQIPVRVTGRLGRLPSPAKGILYGVLLTDIASPDQAASLTLEQAALHTARVTEGDLIAATGFVTSTLYKGQLQLRLRVTTIHAIEEPREQEDRRQTSSVVAALRQAGATRREFPSARKVSVALIRSGSLSAQVADDFRGALHGVGDIQIRDTVAAMDDPSAIAAAIEAVREHVLVIIRGGGDERDFEVFEDPRVIIALGRCLAYRILGLGHSGNRTLADAIADRAETTPTAAGRYLRDKIQTSRLQVDEAEELRRLRWPKPQPTTGKPKQLPINLWLAAATIILLILLVCLFLAR